MSSCSNRFYIWLCAFEIVVIAVLGFIVLERLSVSGVIPKPRDLQQGNSVVEIPRLRDDGGEGAQKKNATMLFVGDIMLSRNIAAQIVKNEDPLYPFLLIASTTREADITFANLENPVSASGTLQGSIYSFRAEPVGSINGLQYAGFDVVSLANNHIWDYGRVAALDTMRYLRDAGIDYVGFGRNYDEANTPIIRQVGDAKVAFFGYTEFYSKELWADEKLGLSEFKKDEISRRVAEIKEFGRADIVVVSLHWGVEYETESNAAQQNIAHQLIDAGADLIIGHHPHVPQEFESYKDGYIVYSLGNFVFDQNFSADTRRGLMFKVTLEGKKMTAAETIEIKFTKTYQPYILNQ